jgi:hypothetical protein
LIRKKKKSRTDEERAIAYEEAQRAIRAAEIAERAQAARSDSREEGDKSGSAAEEGEEASSGPLKKKKTAAEEKFDKIQEERVSGYQPVCTDSFAKVDLHSAENEPKRMH